MNPRTENPETGEHSRVSQVEVALLEKLFDHSADVAFSSKTQRGTASPCTNRWRHGTD